MVQPEQALRHDELIDLKRTAVGENDPCGIQSEALEAVSDEVGGLPTTREGMKEEVIEVRRRVLVEDPERRQRLSDEMAVISAHEVTEIHSSTGYATRIRGGLDPIRIHRPHPIALVPAVAFRAR